MSRDYYAILGLRPGRYEPAEITRRFRALRRRVLSALDEEADQTACWARLDELHLAHQALRDRRAQASYLESRGGTDDLTRLRGLIAASLEGGLLRCSRRRTILEAGRRLGLSDFQTQLLIAQVQFGDQREALPAMGRWRRRADSGAGIGARLAAAGILGLALFLALVRWLGV